MHQHAMVWGKSQREMRIAQRVDDGQAINSRKRAGMVLVDDIHCDIQASHRIDELAGIRPLR